MGMGIKQNWEWEWKGMGNHLSGNVLPWEFMPKGFVLRWAY